MDVLAYSAPSLSEALIPASGDSSGGYLVAFAGDNFGPPAAPLALLFSNPATGARYPCNVTAHTHHYGQCMVGPGAGRGLLVSVATAGRGETPALLANASVVFSYNPPMVSGVNAPGGAPAVGGFPLQLWGSSLTVDPDTAVTVSGRPCVLAPGSRSHVALNCTMPPGYGRHHPIVVTAAGQPSAAFFFDYDPPVVLDVQPVQVGGAVGGGSGAGSAGLGAAARFDAKFGTEVRVLGRNFGSDDVTHGVVALNGTRCSGAMVVHWLQHWLHPPLLHSPPPLTSLTNPLRP